MLADETAVTWRDNLTPGLIIIVIIMSIFLERLSM